MTAKTQRMIRTIVLIIIFVVVAAITVWLLQKVIIPGFGDGKELVQRIKKII